MSSVSQRSTKAELLAAYEALQASTASGPSWPQIGTKLATTVSTVATESAALMKDCYNAGALLRQWISAIVDDLSRPVLRSKA